MRIVITPYAGKRTGRLADGNIEFTDSVLAGFRLIGFTINRNGKGELFVSFPSYNRNGKTPFYFLRPVDQEKSTELLDRLESSILDAYDLFCSSAERAKPGGTPLPSES